MSTRTADAPANSYTPSYARIVAPDVVLPDDLDLILVAFGVGRDVLDGIDIDDPVAVLTRAAWNDPDGVTGLLALGRELRKLRLTATTERQR